MKAANKRVLQFAVFSLMVALAAARAKEPKAVGWGYAQAAGVEVHSRPGKKGRVLLRLGRGSVVEVFESRAGACRVAAMSLSSLTRVMGWVDCTQLETLALDRLPNDDAVLREVGGVFLEDTVRPQIVIARFLASTGGAEPALVCFLASPFLPQARLQVFESVDRHYRARAFLEFSFSEQEPGITALEVRDLLGDGNECLVTHEPVNLGRGETGVNLVIRRLEGGKFAKLWEAPLERRNLASYPPHLEILRPPERNIGAPGTVAKGEVNFVAQGQVSIPVWTGTVEFYALGREAPVETIRLEKACSWSGTQFAPLR